MDWSVKNKDIPELYKMWGDLYLFQKKFLRLPEKKDQSLFWQEVLKEADVIEHTYPVGLCSDIVNAIIEDFRMRIKEG